MSVDPKKIKLPKGATLIQEEKSETDNIVLPPGATLITELKKKDDSKSGQNKSLPSSQDLPHYLAAPPNKALEKLAPDPTFKKNWLDPTLNVGEPDPTPKILFSDYDKKELSDLQTKYKVSTEDPRIKIREAAGLSNIGRPTQSKRPFIQEYQDVVAVENHINEELQKIKTAHQMLRAGSPNPYKKEQEGLEEDLATIQNLKKKTAAELTIEGENKIDAVVRTDQSGNLLKKTMNRLQLTNPIFSGTGAASISLETEDRINKLPSQFVTGLNYLKNAEPVVYERVSKNLKEGLPISESQIATITSQGLELEQARLEKNLQQGNITPEEYNKKANEINIVRKNNILDNRETLRAFLADGIAEKGDYIGKIGQVKNTAAPAAVVTDYLLGHTWNYTDEQIKYFGEQYAKENSIDPQDARVQEAIKYLQDNEGSMIMQNSIAKAGGIREFFKGAAEPIRGISNAIEDLGKSSNDIYAEAQSQGNVNVSEKRLKAEDTGVRGIVNDVVKGTGQFASQAGLAYLTSGGIGAGGRLILGKAGTAAVAGDIAAADMAATDIIGSTLLKSKDALATFVTSYAQVYDSNLKNALNYTSDNALAKRAAAINSSIEGATELFLSPLDIAKGIAKQFRSKGTTKELLEILSDKALEKTPNKLTDFLSKTLKGVVATSEVAAAEIGEEMVTQIADYVTNAYLNPNSESFQNRDLMNELSITAYQTGLSMAVPALLNGVSAANANTFSKGSLLIAAQNRQRLIDDLNENLALKKISQEEYNSKVQLINTAAVANAQLPKKVDNSTLNTNEKADYVFSRVAEAMLANKVKQSKDEAEKTILNKKIKEQQDFRIKMLGGEIEEAQKPSYKVDGNEVSRADLLRIAKGEDSNQYHFEVTGDEETKNLLRTIDKEEEPTAQQAEEKTAETKDAIQLLNEARDKGKLGVFKSMEDEPALKMISQQALNLDEKGQPYTGDDAEERNKMAMESTKNQFGEELVNAAIEKYPAEIKQEPEPKAAEEKKPQVSETVKGKLSALKEKRNANKPVEKTEPVETDEVKPIRQLGTGANVYYESEKYRVNDLQNGKTGLNIYDNAGGLVPMANIEFDDTKQAVEVATELQRVFPKGVPPAILIDKVVEDIEAGKDITKPAATVESELSKNVTPKILRELLNKEGLANKTASGTGATKRKAGDYLYNQDRGAFDALLEDIKTGTNKDSWSKLEEIYNKTPEKKKSKKEQVSDDEYNPDERPHEDIMSENETLEELAISEGQTVPIVAGDYPIDFYAQNDEETGKPVFYVQVGNADPKTFDTYKEALDHFDIVINDYNDGKVTLESYEGEFNFERKESEDIFPEPSKTVNFTTQLKKSSYISQLEAHTIVAAWKNYAKEIGEKEDHSKEVIISIFDASGTWSKPYEDAGYTVIRYDLSRGDDVMRENWAALRADIEASGKVVVGVITAPPCTSFAVSGARWWDAQHDNPSKEWVEKKYGSFAAEYFDRPLDYAVALVDMVKVAVEFLNPTLFHTAENPVGRIQKEADLPNPSLVFNPNNFGDPYTKKTMLWGDINPNLPTANVDPVEGSKMHKLRGDNAEDKKERSQTPEGFSYAFFVANNTSKIVFGKQKQVTKKKSDGTGNKVSKIKAIESKAAAAEDSNNAEQAAEVIKEIDAIIKLTPEQEARELGDKVVDGELVKRQPPVQAVMGKPVDILFAKDEKQPAHYAVIELSDLQPSHRNGVKNENHFIPEAQPRDRGGLEVLKNEAKKKAESLDPSQLADNNIAYFGSPITNTRGEVIQGNGRGEAIDYYYNNDKTDSKGYKKMILSKAQDLGLDKKAITEMKHPVLVRMVNVSDEDAIVLGNYTSSDLEDVKQKNAEAKSAIGKLKQSELTKLADTIGGRIGENDTLKGAIRDNAKPIIDLLMDNGVLRADNREQYFNKDGVTPEGIEAAHNVVRQLLFEGGVNELAGKFDNLSFFQREAIEKTIPAILSNRELKTNVQTVIEILHDKTESGTASFNTWAKQYDMFKGGKAPVDLYNHANLALAKKIDEAKTQKEISTTIKELAALMNGAPETLFDAAKPGLPFEESIAEKNIAFAIQEPTTEEVSDIVDIIKDLIDEGTLRLKQIQDYVANELEDNSPELRDLVATAYHEYGKQYTPKEITQGVIGRIGGFLSKIFGGKGSEKIFIAKNQESLISKAEQINYGDPIQYQINNNGRKFTVQSIPEVVNGFYSPLEKAIDEIKVDKLPAKQWAEKFQGEEAKWTGLTDWLNSQTGSISKSEIQQYLKDNRIEVVEVVKGSEGVSEKTKEEKLEDIKTAMRRYGNYGMDKDMAGDWYVTKDGENIIDEAEIESLPDEIKDLSQEFYSIAEEQDLVSNNEELISGVKYSGYQLPGEKTNYKEVLITMPRKLLTADFKSVHWSEPNILAHVRMNTRIDAEGKKVLFLEEIQSDWGETGRKQGFENERDKTIYNFAKSIYNIRNRAALKSITAEEANTQLKSEKVLSESQGITQAEIEKALTEYGDFTKSFKEGQPTAPFVTDTNAWTKLAFKVALKEAVKQGADKIAWTTGEQQADRFDLSYQVDKIVARRDNENEVSIDLWKNNSVVSGGGYTNKELINAVGKQLSDKILNQPINSVVDYEGLDLKIGGEGMEGFYGNPSKNKLGIVGNVAKSLFKQEPKKIEIGGKLVEETIDNIKSGETIIPEQYQDGSIFRSEVVDENTGEVVIIESKNKLSKSELKNRVLEELGKRLEQKKSHSVDITPEMRVQVESGLPLFMKTTQGEILGFTHNGKIYLNGERLNPNTPIHEAGHIWTEWTKQNNRAVYDRGIELIIGSLYMGKVKENKFYKKEAEKLAPDEREQYFQHEALAMAIGDKGAQFITQAKKNGFKEWLNNLWERIKNAAGFTDITALQLEKLTFEQFAERAAADILRNEDVVEEEIETESSPGKQAKDNLAAYSMTTSDATNKFLSGKTIENIFGEAPEGNQSYYVQKLSDMLQDGKNMVAIAQGAWGTDISDYGRKLFSYIRKMSMDQELSNKKAVLLATFLGEIKEEISRNEDRRTELQPLYNQVEGYYQGYMNIVGKSAAAGRLLRLYRDKYMGDIFANRILEEQQIREKEELRKAQEDSERISDLVAAEVSRITAEQKEKADKDADEKVKKEKKKSEKKGKLSQTEAEQMAAEKMEAIKTKGGLTAFVDKIKDAISKINCK